GHDHLALRAAFDALKAGAAAWIVRAAVANGRGRRRRRPAAVDQARRLKEVRAGSNPRERTTHAALAKDAAAFEELVTDETLRAGLMNGRPAPVRRRLRYHHSGRATARGNHDYVGANHAGSTTAAGGHDDGGVTPVDTTGGPAFHGATFRSAAIRAPVGTTFRCPSVGSAVRTTFRGATIRTPVSPAIRAPVSPAIRTPVSPAIRAPVSPAICTSIGSTVYAPVGSAVCRVHGGASGRRRCDPSHPTAFAHARLAHRRRSEKQAEKGGKGQSGHVSSDGVGEWIFIRCRAKPTSLWDGVRSAAP
ncbi:MAG: hypothetical protein AAF938_20540, partial [Myxococcota bacterium]